MRRLLIAGSPENHLFSCTCADCVQVQMVQMCQDIATGMAFVAEQGGCRDGTSKGTVGDCDRNYTKLNLRQPNDYAYITSQIV